MNTPNRRKYQTKYYRNKNEDYSLKNNSYISIHQKQLIKKKVLPTLNFNEQVNDHNSYLIVPAYQTLKAQNYIKNFNYQPSYNFIDNKSNNQFEEKYFSNNNGAMSVKSLSTINQKLLNKYKKIDLKIKSFENSNRLYTDNIIEKLNSSSSTNSNAYKGVYNTIHSPRRSRETYLIKQVMDKDSFTILNSHNYSNNKNLFDNFQNNKVKKIKYNNNVENFIKKLNNSKRNKSTFEKIMNSIYCPDKKIINAKSYKCIKNDKILKLIKNSKEINKLKGEYFKKIDINSYPYYDKLIKYEGNQNLTKNMNHSLKSNVIENLDNSNIIFFKKMKNINLNSIITSNISHTNLFFQKAIGILIKVIKNRIYNYFLSIKYILYKEKNFSNYNNYIRKIKNYKNISRQNCQITKKNTFDIAMNNNKLINHKEHNAKLIRNNISQKKGLEIKYKELLNENLKLQNYNNILKNEKKEIIKQLLILKEENKKFRKNSEINYLINENIKLSNKLKYLYMKNLINIKDKHHIEKLKQNFHIFQRKTYCIYEKDEKRKNILRHIINKKEYIAKNILRKFFCEFYVKSKIQKNFFQRERLIKLMDILHKKENNILLQKKKYFDKFYYSVKKAQEKLLEKAAIFTERRQNKLNAIINKTMKKINSITEIKSILKQWVLRTKIINMKIMLVKEENNKNIIKPIENLIKSKEIKNIIINNCKKDNLIKGIKKLNSIFTSYESVNKSNNENENKNNSNNELNNLNQKIDNNINKNDLNKKENLIYKIYHDKLLYKSNDWIIEEKEEEQTGDNGESISFKNDNDQIINYNIIDSYN